MKPSALPTPALLLDRSLLERNLERMAERARALDVALRPHVKTHKCVEIARMQRERGARGITVSTLAEAAAFVDAGFDDVTYAVPLPLSALDAALALAERCTLRLLLDARETLEALEAAAGSRGRPLHAWLKVDCGYHRAGVDPNAPAARALAARMAASPSVIFDGLLTHAGHAYQAFDRQARLQIARDERATVVGMAKRLRADGIDVPALSVGSTPTMTVVEDLSGVHEARPGNYAYFDLTQATLGSCQTDDIALSVLTTVVSRQGQRAVVDAGALALSKDSGPGVGPFAGQLGAVCRAVDDSAIDPSLRLVALSQEHGVIEPAIAGGLAGRLAVGTRLRLLPNHSCLTSACFDAVHVVEGGAVADRWTIHRQR